MLNIEMNLDVKTLAFYWLYNFPLFFRTVTKKNPKNLQSYLCHIAACYGPGMDNNGAMDNHGNTMVTSSNVEQFNKCTKIFGSLAFHPQSFTRYETINPQGNT